tara:strand:+ start:298 stop:534 length:237 start_codon:yes stop_codon:yes gene_type:complete
MKEVNSMVLKYLLDMTERGDETAKKILRLHEEQDKENFIAALQHWAEFFKSNDDDYADDIAYLLEDKAHDIKMEIENA